MSVRTQNDNKCEKKKLGITKNYPVPMTFSRYHMLLNFQLCIMYDMHSMGALKRPQSLLFSATTATAVTTFPGTSKIDEKHAHKTPTLFVALFFRTKVSN